MATSSESIKRRHAAQCEQDRFPTNYTDGYRFWWTRTYSFRRNTLTYTFYVRASSGASAKVCWTKALFPRVWASTALTRLCMAHRLRLENKAAWAKARKRKG